VQYIEEYNNKNKEF